MILKRVKDGWVWVKSFFKPQPVRSSVLINGQDDAGTVNPGVQFKMYEGIATFTPYPIRYVLIGTEAKKGDPGKVLYRFLDPQTKTEFLLTRPLVDLLMHRVPPTLPKATASDAMVANKSD